MKKHIQQILKGFILTAIGTLIGIGLMLFRGNLRSATANKQTADLDVRSHEASPFESSTFTARKLLSAVSEDLKNPDPYCHDPVYQVDGITHFIKPHDTLSYQAKWISSFDSHINPFDCSLTTKGIHGSRYSLTIDKFKGDEKSDKESTGGTGNIPKKFHFSGENPQGYSYFHFTNDGEGAASANDVLAINCAER